MERCKCGDARENHFAMKTAWVGPARTPQVVCWGRCRMAGCGCDGYRPVREAGSPATGAATPAPSAPR